MANVLKMMKVESIQLMRSAGLSCREIARRLGINRETVSRYVSLGREPISKPASAPISPAGSESPVAGFGAPIGVEVAAALVAHKGQRLGLYGVKEISPEVARALANGKRSGGIVLGLTELPPDLAVILADFPYDLDFPKLESLSLESAQAIRKHGVAVKVGGKTRGPSLGLGKAKISPAVAEALLLHDGPLSLMLVKRLEPGVGDILARHRFELHLMLEEIDSVTLARKLFSEGNASSSVSNLRTISPDIAVEYARRGPGLFIHLDALSPAAAAELAKCRRSLWFFALSDVSPELARALTDREPMVHLGGIKALDGPDALAVAEALASTPAPVEMPNLERISAPALAALRKKATITIPPAEKLTIVP